MNETILWTEYKGIRENLSYCRNILHKFLKFTSRENTQNTISVLPEFSCRQIFAKFRDLWWLENPYKSLHLPIYSTELLEHIRISSSYYIQSTSKTIISPKMYEEIAFCTNGIHLSFSFDNLLLCIWGYIIIISLKWNQ